MIDHTNGSLNIKFRVSEEEDRIIRENAKACGKTVSAYAREVALNMAVIQIDQSVVSRHADVVSSYRNAVLPLIYRIMREDRYAPADIEYILAKTTELLKSEQAFLRDHREQINDIKDSMIAEIRSEVHKQLHQSGEEA